MYILKKYLLIAFTIFSLSFYNICFAEVESHAKPIPIDAKVERGHVDSSDHLKSFGGNLETNVEPIQARVVLKHIDSSNNLDTYVGNQGPNQYLPGPKYYTSEIDGRVLLRTEPDYGVIQPMSVPGLMEESVKNYGDLPALSYISDGEWVTVTYNQYQDKVRTVARAFISLGLERHHSVGILGSNSPEWFYSSLGAIFAGGISAGIDTTMKHDACVHCLKKSKANIVVVEDDKQLVKILSMKEELTDLKKIILCNGSTTDDEMILSWTQLIKLGEYETDEKYNDTQKYMAVNECCTLVFTHGTEGKPKAVMLSHDNLIVNTYIIISHFKVQRGAEIIVSYLPLSRVEAQITDIYSAMTLGVHVYFADKDALNDKDTLFNTLRQIRPTIFIGVPSVWENLKDILVENKIEPKTTHILCVGFVKRFGFNCSGKEGSTIREHVVSPKVTLGFDRTKVFITAAAPILREVKQFFLDQDIPLIEAYGMAECSGIHAISNPTDDVKSVGKTLPGALSVIHNRGENGIGELCINGNQVFMGYLGLPKETAKTIDLHGWFYTGDLAIIDENELVTITGRIKELVITSGGEKVSPAYIENNVIAELPIISNAYLVGEKRPYLSILLSLKCIVVPYPEDPSDEVTSDVTKMLSPLGYNYTKVSEIIKHKPEKFFDAIQKKINVANMKAISDAHKIKKFEIMPVHFRMLSTVLGPKLNASRHQVTERFKYLIQNIYS